MRPPKLALLIDIVERPPKLSIVLVPERPERLYWLVVPAVVVTVRVGLETNARSVLELRASML